MIAYRQAWHPNLAQIVTPVVSPAVVSTAPVSSPVSGAPVPEGLFWTAVAGAAAYAGIYTGMKEKGGVVKWAGWIGGVGAGLAALAGLTGVLAPSTASRLPIRWFWV